MILWRTREAGHRTPAALDGCRHIARVDLLPTGALLTADDPLLIHEPAAWVTTTDGWQVGRRPGPGDHHCLLREALHLPLVVVTDAQGQPWTVPAILRPDGVLNLHLPVRKQPGGTWARTPTPAQAALIQIATEARQLIEADQYHTLPLEAAATWCATLLSAVYHLTPDDLGALDLIDDALLARVPAAAAGFPLPESLTPA